MQVYAKRERDSDLLFLKDRGKQLNFRRYFPPDNAFTASPDRWGGRVRFSSLYKENRFTVTMFGQAGVVFTAAFQDVPPRPKVHIWT